MVGLLGVNEVIGRSRGDRGVQQGIGRDQRRGDGGVAGVCRSDIHSFSSLFALLCAAEPFVRLLNLRISSGVLNERGGGGVGGGREGGGGGGGGGREGEGRGGKRENLILIGTTGFKLSQVS